MKGVPKQLKVGINPTVNIFQVNHTDAGIKVIGGFESEILQVYADSLGSELEYAVPTDEVTWGRKLPNDTWTGILGLVHRNEVDFIMGCTLLREERTQVGIPSATYKLEEVRFLTRLPNLEAKTLVFIEPFVANVWFSILSTLVITSLVLYWLQGKKHTFLEQLFSLTAMLLQQGAEIEPTDTFANRIPFACWTIVAQLLSLSYMSVLLSFMTVPRREPVIDTVEKLLNVLRSGKYKVAVPRDIPLYLQWLLTSKNPSNRKLGNYAVKNNWYVPFSGPEVIRALKNNFAVVFPLFGKRLWINSGVLVSKDIFFSGGLVIYMKKSFCCEEAMNLVIERADAGGIYQKILNHYVFKLQVGKEKNELEEEIDDIKTLTLEDLNGCFILLAIGVAASILVFIAELIHKRISMKEKKIRGKINGEQKNKSIKETAAKKFTSTIEETPQNETLFEATKDNENVFSEEVSSSRNKETLV